jgi:uncharacterized protein GlcG (DUF336 family)
MIPVLLSTICALPLHAQQAPAGPGLPPAMATGGPPPGPRRPDPIVPGPSLETALKLAEAIVTACKGFKIGIGVGILDSAGLPKLLYVSDGAAGFHAYTAFRKASTALKFGMPSGKVAEAIKTDPQLAEKYMADQQNLNTNAGGLLLMASSEVIGAVGVSGAEPGAHDEPCALAGIKAVQSMFK